MIYYKYFKEFWMPVYRKQYKSGDKETKRAIRHNLFSNCHLTDKQKELIWERIVK